MQQPERPAAPRIGELDALRGLAALSVFLGHILQTILGGYEHTWLVRLIRTTPLAAAVTGTEAVRFFFVLSGFVLALSYLRRPGQVAPFLVRRVLRIYPAYLAAVVVGFLGASALYHGAVPGRPAAFNLFWQAPPSATDVLEHVGMSVPQERNLYVPTIWSLVVEMRMSLALPLIMAVITAWPAWRILVLAVALSLGEDTWNQLHGGQPFDLACPTVYYTGMFIVGILLALRRDQLVASWSRLSRRVKIELLAAAWLAYTYPHWYFPHVGWLHPWWVNEWMLVIGSAIIIILAQSSPRLGAFLRRRPLVFLGQVSYSLYLWHVVVILAVGHSLRNRISDWQLAGLAVLLVPPVSWLSYRYIEVPFMRLGRTIAERMAAPRMGTNQAG
ncbi:MAG: acyltransferase [Armatimonadetes bacterium]|nr:acyltransferase [Armatimonadota bacterium]